MATQRCRTAGCSNWAVTGKNHCKARMWIHSLYLTRNAHTKLTAREKDGGYRVDLTDDIEKNTSRAEIAFQTDVVPEVDAMPYHT